MTPRAYLAETRNPVLALPAARALADLDQETRFRLGVLLRQLSSQAREKAEKCWRTHKAPMAAYWKAVAVYARHADVAIRRKATHP